MKFDSLEAIVDFAIEKEKEAVQFYSGLAKEEAFFRYANANQQEGQPQPLKFHLDPPHAEAMASRQVLANSSVSP